MEPKKDHKFCFVDDYGCKCTLQDSPVVVNNKYIWLGIDRPRIMEVGWHPKYPNRLRELSKERYANLHVAGYMHLTREQVIKLLPHLQQFIESGEI